MPYSDPARQAEYQRDWVARRRAEWFAGKKCAWCAAAKQLELDHVDGSKKVSHRIWSWSAQRREDELAKCQVLCRQCHVKKTDAAGENPDKLRARRHGTKTMYGKWGCRCPACKAGNAARQARFRAARKSQGE